MNDLPDIKTIRLRTPVGYLSFPELFEAKDKWESGRKKFSCSMQIPKKMTDENKERWNELHKSILKFGLAEFGTSAVIKKDGKVKPDFDVPVMDGDEHKYEGNRGYWLLRATSNERFPPRVLDPDNNVIEAPSDLTQAGAEAELLVGLYYYKFQGKRGCSLNLYAVRCLGGETVSAPPIQMPASEAANAFGAKPALLGGTPPQLDGPATDVNLDDVEEFLAD